MNHLSIRIAAAWATLRAELAELADRGDAGEGVISTALAVLIVAFLGVAAFTLFNQLVADSGNAASEHIKSYGG